jgi:hypothetical protein
MRGSERTRTWSTTVCAVMPGATAPDGDAGAGVDVGVTAGSAPQVAEPGGGEDAAETPGDGGGADADPDWLDTPGLPADEQAPSTTAMTSAAD